MPETLWINRVRVFGPLIISIDTQGNNLIQQNKDQFQARESRCWTDLPAPELHQ
jgi:L(+)-tartrate dehydratase beta subunit